MGAINKNFAGSIYEASVGLGIHPLFITAMTCLESDWGRKSVLEHNLFGERYEEPWNGGRKLIRVTEIHPSVPKLLEGEFVVSKSTLNDGMIKYIIMRWYKDYHSIRECLCDHIRVFGQFPNAMKYKGDAHEFPKKLSNEPFIGKNGQKLYKKYDSSPNYSKYIEIMYKTLLKLGIK